jgi:hypothetical protein
MTQKRGAERRLFDFCDRGVAAALRARQLLSSFGQPALVASRSVLVDQSFPRCAIQKFHRRKLFLGISASGRALERGTERGPLRAISDRGSARFAHVLFR